MKGRNLQESGGGRGLSGWKEIREGEESSYVLEGGEKEFREGDGGGRLLSFRFFPDLATRGKGGLSKGGAPLLRA